jgi:SulP family sulfate permease
MRWPFSFRPKSFDTLKGYTLNDFWSDLAAGVTVGVVALPLAMAFAIASGLRPEAGLFTAVIAGIIISVFGGSKVQIGGPAGAFIVIVYRIVTDYGVDGLIISTILAGVCLFAMGALRLGTLVRFVPVSIVIGFTNGIAVVIALSQIKDLFGLKMGAVPSDFFPKIVTLVEHRGDYNATACALSAVSLMIVFGWPRLAKLSGVAALQRIPGSILALVGGTMAVSFLNLPVETIGTKFGGIPSALPHMTWPSFNFETAKNLLYPTFTLALLGAIESLLCARVADGLIGDRHNPNQELMAQGMANIAAPLFGGYVATGTIARTVTNVRSGAKSPVAGVIHALTLLLIMTVASGLAKDVPLATLAAVLIFVAYNMGEWHEFVRMRHFTFNYKAVLMTTFILTVVVDLTVAVGTGLGLAFLFFATRVSGLTSIEPIAEIEGEGHARLGRDIEAYRVRGSLFFASVHRLEELVDPSRAIPKVMILSFADVLNIDSSGLDALENVRKTLKQKGSCLLISHVQGQPQDLMGRSKFMEAMGKKHFFPTTVAAMDYARKLLGQAIVPNTAIE